MRALALCLSVVAWVCGCGPTNPAPVPTAAGPPPELFTAEVVTNGPAQFAAQTIAKRHRFARPNLGVQTVLEKRGAVRLNLFGDVSFDAVITECSTQFVGVKSGQAVPAALKTKDPDEQLLLKLAARGHLKDDPRSMVDLVFHDGKLTGTVTAPAQRQFIISHLGGGVHAIIETKPVTPQGD